MASRSRAPRLVSTPAPSASAASPQWRLAPSLSAPTLFVSGGLLHHRFREMSDPVNGARRPPGFGDSTPQREWTSALRVGPVSRTSAPYSTYANLEPSPTSSHGRPKRRANRAPAPAQDAAGRPTPSATSTVADLLRPVALRASSPSEASSSTGGSPPRGASPAVLEPGPTDQQLLTVAPGYTHTIAVADSPPRRPVPPTTNARSHRPAPNSDPVGPWNQHDIVDDAPRGVEERQLLVPATGVVGAGRPNAHALLDGRRPQPTPPSSRAPPPPPPPSAPNVSRSPPKTHARPGGKPDDGGALSSWDAGGYSKRRVAIAYRLAYARSVAHEMHAAHGTPWSPIHVRSLTGLSVTAV